MKHRLWADGDEDVPYFICDRNGQVALAVCKICGQCEGELEETCPGPDPAEHTYDLYPFVVDSDVEDG